MDRVIEKYYGIFPTILFSYPDDTNSMHFVLCLKNTPEDDKNEIVKLMRHCNAEVSFKLQDVRDFSIVIVDHDNVVDFSGPAFTLQYVADCLLNVGIKDISDYRQHATRHIAQHVHPMEVVYFKKWPWNSVLKEEEKIWIKMECSKGNTWDLCEPTPTEESVDINAPGPSIMVHSREPEVGSNSLCQTHSGGIDLSDDEDEDILSMSREPEVESNSLCQTHSGRINLSDDEDEDILSMSSEPEIGSKRMCQTRSGGINLSDDEDEDILSMSQEPEVENQQSLPPSEGSNHSGDGDEDNELSVSLDDCETESSDKDWPVPDLTTKPSKRTKSLYSDEERCDILKYIINHNEYGRVRGRELWCIMERRKVCPKRTWQSMKEHFLKKILTELDAYPFLTAEQKKMLRNPYC